MAKVYFPLILYTIYHTIIPTFLQQCMVVGSMSCFHKVKLRKEMVQREEKKVMSFSGIFFFFFWK
jgi:cytochrome bd-type quinol oxidase subunit 1